jgi:hypothetical protein
MRHTLTISNYPIYQKKLIIFLQYLSGQQMKFNEIRDTLIENLQKQQLINPNLFEFLIIEELEKPDSMQPFWDHWQNSAPLSLDDFERVSAIRLSIYSEQNAEKCVQI